MPAARMSGRGGAHRCANNGARASQLCSTFLRRSLGDLSREAGERSEPTSAATQQTEGETATVKPVLHTASNSLNPKLVCKRRVCCDHGSATATFQERRGSCCITKVHLALGKNIRERYIALQAGASLASEGFIRGRCVHGETLLFQLPSLPAVCQGHAAV